MKREGMTVWLLTLALAGAAWAQESAAGLLREYFEAVNSGEYAAMVEFYEEGVTEGFRARRSEEEDRALYERIRGDLGRLTVEGLRRLGPNKAVAQLSAEKMALPVEFTFDLAEGRIDGIAINVPVPNGSNLDLATQLKRSLSVEEVNDIVRAAAENELGAYLQYVTEPIDPAT